MRRLGLGPAVEEGDAGLVRRMVVQQVGGGEERCEAEEREECGARVDERGEVGDGGEEGDDEEKVSELRVSRGVFGGEVYDEFFLLYNMKVSFDLWGQKKRLL